MVLTYVRGVERLAGGLQGVVAGLLLAVGLLAALPPSLPLTLLLTSEDEKDMTHVSSAQCNYLIRPGVNLLL